MPHRITSQGPWESLTWTQIENHRPDKLLPQLAFSAVQSENFRLKWRWSN
jgi:hypothetical protein